MSDYPMLISNKLHSFRNFKVQRYKIFQKFTQLWVLQNLRFRKNIARVLKRVSLAGFIRCFRLSVWQKPQACRTGVRTAGTF